MTVEAAVALPLFLFFLISLGSFIEMIRLHGNIQLALWKVGRELAVYGSVLDAAEVQEKLQLSGEDNGWWEKAASAVISSVALKWWITEEAGRQYLDTSPLAGGADSLALWESNLFEAGDELELVVTYPVLPGSWLDFFPFRMANRCYVHAWTGYEIPAGEEGGRTVYVAENASVYHVDRSCTHLQLSVRQIPAGSLSAERNQYGKGYTRCERCGNKGETLGDTTVLYVAREGDRYHFYQGCSGLKRTVTAVSREEAASRYAPCSRCGRQEESGG